MTPEAFCYWLQGFSELDGQQPDNNQWQIIQDHLNLVFDKVTPDRENLKLTQFDPNIVTQPYKISEDFDPNKMVVIC